MCWIAWALYPLTLHKLFCYAASLSIKAMAAFTFLARGASFCGAALCCAFLFHAPFLQLLQKQYYALNVCGPVDKLFPPAGVHHDMYFSRLNTFVCVIDTAHAFCFILSTRAWHCHHSLLFSHSLGISQANIIILDVCWWHGPRRKLILGVDIVCKLIAKHLAIHGESVTQWMWDLVVGTIIW